MKYKTGFIYLIGLFVLLSSCTAKKDIVSEQSDSMAAAEVYADNTSLTDTAPLTTDNKITDIRISEQSSGDSQVFISARKKPNYTIFKMSKPDRIIVDVPDAESEPIPELNPDNNLVSRIRSSVLSEKDLHYVRIEIILKQDVGYSAQIENSSIIIAINKKSSAKPADPTPAVAGSAMLIKSTHKPAGNGNVIQLQLRNHIPRYHAYKLQNPARIVIELENTVSQINAGTIRIHENLIEKIRFGQKQKDLKIVFDINDSNAPPYQITQSGDLINVAVGSDSIAAAQKNGPAAEAAKAPAPSPAADKKEVPAEAAPAESQTAANDPKYAGTAYTGEKISLDFKDADLKNVLRLLGDIGGINMTIGEKVGGKVTLRLENIPVDEALDIVLINNGLDKTVTPQYTRIDTVDQIKKFNDDRAQAKRAYEQAEDTTIRTFPISYAQASNLASFIKQMNVLTPNRGSVNFFELTNKLTVSDIPSVIAKIEGIISEQDIPTRQVMIESRVVQSSPSWVKDLGIAWGGTYTGHGNNATIPITGAAGNNRFVNLAGAANGAINIGYITDKYALDATLTALENEDKLKILSNPRLLTLDNKEATIKQGVQLPYLKLNENGVTSTEFKDAVLEMKVKPKITAANTIAIEIDVKKDQKSAQTGTGNEPGIDVRQIKTDLLVESGKTVVIGGIYETTKSKNVKKVPFFSKIPLIGPFAFTSVREEETLTEMLVFITVTIVESPQNIAFDKNENTNLK